MQERSRQGDQGAEGASAAFRLLLLCARPRRFDGFAEQAGALLNDRLDWQALIRLALEHRLVPLVNLHLQGLDDPELPGDLMDALSAFCAQATERNQQLAEELGEIVGALEARGIAPIPFKGPLLAVEAYGELSLRGFADLDILVRETDIAGTLEVLRQRGYEEPGLPVGNQGLAIQRYAGQVLLGNRDQSVWIEPHFRYTNSTFALRTDYDGLWARAKTTRLAGRRMLTLAPEDQLIALAVHGSKEEWLRLSWISDIAAAIEAYAELDWNAALARAEREHCLRMLLTALGLAQRVLGTALPDEASRRLRSDAETRACVDWALRRLQSGTVAREDGLSLFRYRMHDRLADRLSYALRTITTPTIKHYLMIDLPTWLSAGYYPVKQVHDYLMLPAWLAYKRIAGRP